jgi:hypothetical protein
MTGLNAQNPATPHPPAKCKECLGMGMGMGIAVCGYRISDTPAGGRWESD